MSVTDYVRDLRARRQAVRDRAEAARMHRRLAAAANRSGLVRITVLHLMAAEALEHAASTEILDPAPEPGTGE